MKDRSFPAIDRDTRQRLIRIVTKSPDEPFGGDDFYWLVWFISQILSCAQADPEQRDNALRLLYEHHTEGRPQERRDQLRRLCNRYEHSKWVGDRTRVLMRPEYVGTAHEHLFNAFTFGNGQVPLSDKSLRLILATHCFT